MRVPDVIIGAAFTAGGVAVLVATTGFPRQTDGSPGPALFPQVLAILTVLCGGALAVRAVMHPVAPPSMSADGLGPRGIANALAVFVAIIVFMVAGPALGFLVTSATILSALMWWLGARPVRAVLASVGMTLFVYVVFGKILRVPLPLGLVWF